MDKKERRSRLHKIRKSKETIIGMQTTRFRAEWRYTGSHICEGHVPNSVMKEGDRAIFSWLWDNELIWERDDTSEYIPSFLEIIEED